MLVNNPYIADQFQTGGITEIIHNQIPFVGLNESEIRTGSIGRGLLGLQYRLAKKAYLTGRFNAALYNFHGMDFKNLSGKNNLLTGYGLSFGFDSAIGPLEFTIMYCDQDKTVRSHINMGFNF